MSILIAEDDPHLRNGIVDLLTLEGFPCQVAEDGAKALALFQEQRPDLCVFDVMMPTMDGLTLCREIRRLDPLVPILLCRRAAKRRIASAASMSAPTIMWRSPSALSN